MIENNIFELIDDTDSIFVDIEPAELLVVESNSPKSKLTIIPTPGFYMTFPKAKPNWWLRLWQRVLLGWMWEDIEATQ